MGMYLRYGFIVLIILAMTLLINGEIHGFAASASFPSGKLQSAQADDPHELERVDHFVHAVNDNKLGSSTSTAAGKKLWLISIPGLSFVEWDQLKTADFPHMRQLISESAVGAMNIRTPVPGVDDSYLTMGAGAPAIMSVRQEAYARKERITKDGKGATAVELYRRLNGLDPPQSAELLVPDIAAIARANEEARHGAKPGKLGDLLRQYGIGAYVFDNRGGWPAKSLASQEREPATEDAAELEAEEESSPVVTPTRRHAPMMLMTSEGLVYHGDLNCSSLLHNVERPYEAQTNYARLLQRLDGLPREQSAVVLLELGDLERLYDEKSRYREEVFSRLKMKVLHEVDTFIGRAAERLGNADALWIISPFVHAEAKREKRLLAPILMYERSGKPGLLTSPTTRREGIVANIDIAPAIAELWHINVPSEMNGRAIVKQPTDIAGVELDEELRRIENVYRLRPGLLYTLVTYEVIVLLAGLAYSLLGGTLAGRRRIGALMRALLLSMLATPLLLLGMGFFAGLAPPLYIGCVLAGLAAAAWLLATMPVWTAVGGIACLTALTILADGVADAYLMKHSVLGYDVMIGARYYGIGNEYEGVLIGAAILGAAVALQRWHWRRGKPRGGRGRLRAAATAPPAAYRIAIVSALTIVILYMAAPFWGSDAGGAIAAAAAAAACGARMLGRTVPRPHAPRRARWRLLAYGAAAVAAALAALWLLNAALPAAAAHESHIGRALRLLQEGRYDAIADTIIRKLRMNWRLIGVSSWSKLLVTALFVMAVTVWLQRGMFRRWQERHPYLMHGFAASAVGAVAALLINDSGVVAAATAIVYIAVPMLLLRLSPEEDIGNQPVPSRSEREV